MKIIKNLIKHKINKRFLIAEALALMVIVSLILVFYPRLDLSVDGSFVKFNSINSNVIMISDNEQFISPRYFDMSKVNNLSFNLNPGKYYYKSYNGLIESVRGEFEIATEVGLKLDENEDNLVNIGNVKINVTRNKEGRLVGNIVLDPNEKNDINQEIGGEEYVAREV